MCMRACVCVLEVASRFVCVCVRVGGCGCVCWCVCDCVPSGLVRVRVHELVRVAWACRSRNGWHRCERSCGRVVSGAS